MINLSSGISTMIFDMKKFIVITSIVLFGCNTQAQKKTDKVIGFYNIENLFDTINQPHNDEEFLPTGKNQWTSERYLKKLDRLNQVIDSLGDIVLLGFAEIENKQVLVDLNNASKARKNFDVVHFDSPDERGVDVGMIFNPAVLKVVDAGYLRFTLEKSETPHTRDIVWGKFVHKKDTIFSLVNHWPSRRSGQETSEPNRVKAATVAANFIDSVMRVSPKSKIIFMGDLNDHPSDKAPKLISERLNPMITNESGKFGGTYNYKNEWNILDHLMVSPNATKGKFKIIPNSGIIYSNDFILEEFKGQIVPKRNYAGSKYLDGYSDHLPVTIHVSFK